jgi:hypothetical protein
VVTWDPVSPVVVGIDVAKESDQTVVTVLNPDYNQGGMVADIWHSYKHILNWLELQGDNYVAQRHNIADFLANYRNKKRIIIDATGVGAGLSDMLQDEYRNEIDKGELEFIEFNATVETNNDGYKHFLLDLQNGWIEYPNSDRAKKLAKQRNFVLQLTNLRKIYRGAHLGAEAGDATPRKDYCSSLMLASYGTDVSESMGQVEDAENFVMARETTDKSDRRESRKRQFWDR